MNMWMTHQNLPRGTSTRQALVLVRTVRWSSKWMTHVTWTTFLSSLVTILTLCWQVTMPFAAVLHSVAIDSFTTRAGVAGSAVHDKREPGFEETVQESERRASVDSGRFTSSQSWYDRPFSRIDSRNGFAERKKGKFWYVIIMNKGQRVKQ